MRRHAHCESPSLSSVSTSSMTSLASQQTPESPGEGVRLGRRQAALYLGAVGGLGLLCPQQRPHLADLPVHTGAGGAAQGGILLHAVPVVPHLAHVAREQGAGKEGDGLALPSPAASGPGGAAEGGERRRGAAPDGLQLLQRQLVQGDPLGLRHEHRFPRGLVGLAEWHLRVRAEGSTEVGVPAPCPAVGTRASLTTPPPAPPAQPPTLTPLRTR